MTDKEESPPEPQLWFGDSHTLDMPSEEDRKILSDAVSSETTRTPSL